MDSDLRTFVTGGGIGGEGIQIWDLRNFEKPVCKIGWESDSSCATIQKAINAVKFIQGKGMVIAASSHDIPAKCFNFKTGLVV